MSQFQRIFYDKNKSWYIPFQKTFPRRKVTKQLQIQLHEHLKRVHDEIHLEIYLPVPKRKICRGRNDIRSTLGKEQMVVRLEEYKNWEGWTHDDISREGWRNLLLLFSFQTNQTVDLRVNQRHPLGNESRFQQKIQRTKSSNPKVNLTTKDSNELLQINELLQPVKPLEKRHFQTVSIVKSHQGHKRFYKRRSQKERVSFFSN